MNDAGMNDAGMDDAGMNDASREPVRVARLANANAQGDKALVA